ncbi:tRNA (mnm(5)s(2)U34)-methyltransferase [Paenibacillus sp. IHBB 10380]|uniref:tRNA (mnm(5)s(2)U34)-methyltransferase n=1 Tax=Paenibacillus sp. IHBB 10380 TaxID=1566358 RepID=UPI0005CFD2C8|nr:class I SAM-dependent methyltransferase [Paenibacillus sp. IHBB 10380]AJS59724.1 SAM-dependent methyltransferase [Paenibacillus sp. IHBB 10380]
MGFLSVLSFAHKLVSERITSGDVVVDATIGTGTDTLFLSRSVGPRGHVFGFDIQQEALVLTQQRLDHNAHMPLSPVTLFAQSHADMNIAISTQHHGHLAAVMFNLGYLPSGTSDKQIITMADSSIMALDAALSLLKPGGIITVVLYPGHPGGEQEADAVTAWASYIEQSVAQSIIYRQLQRSDAPYVIALEKK